MDLLLMIVIAAGAIGCASVLRWARFPGGLLAAGIVGGAIAGVFLSAAVLGKAFPEVYNDLVRVRPASIEALQDAIANFEREQAVLEASGVSEEAVLEHAANHLHGTLVALDEAMAQAKLDTRRRLGMVLLCASAVLVGGVGFLPEMLRSLSMLFFVGPPLAFVVYSSLVRDFYSVQQLAIYCGSLAASYTLGLWMTRRERPPRTPKIGATHISEIGAVSVVVATTTILAVEQGVPDRGRLLLLGSFTLLVIGYLVIERKARMAKHEYFTPDLPAWFLGTLAVVGTSSAGALGLLGISGCLLIYALTTSRVSFDTHEHMRAVALAGALRRAQEAQESSGDQTPQPTPPNDR